MPNMKKPKKNVPPAVKQAAPVRPVAYRELTVNGVPIPREKLRVTAEKMKKVLGWQTEVEWAEEVIAGKPELKDAKITFDSHVPPIEPLGTDRNGERFICWNNLDNRNFKPKLAEAYMQDILNGCWAGPSNGGKVTLPLREGGAAEFDELTVNGETLIVSRTGQCLSVQHRGVGLVWAQQEYDKSGSWRERWPDGVFIESLIVFGISDSDRVVQTIDNVAKRTDEDVILTSKVFADVESRKERRILSNGLAAATATLWDRTGASETGDKHQTHSASVALRDRHPKLLECVREVFEINKEFGLSVLKLSPGQCAACMYLMGSADSDGAEYRAGDPPQEASLDWDKWDAAVEFFRLLADKKRPTLEHVRKALGDLYQDEEHPGTARTKQAVLTLAWQVHVTGKKPQPTDLELHWAAHPQTGNVELLDEECLFGGIDSGWKGVIEEDGPPPPTKEEIRKAEAEKAKAAVKAAAATKPSAKSPAADGKPPPPKLLKTPLHKRAEAVSVTIKRGTVK